MELIRDALASGSGPNSKRENAYMLQMYVYGLIRQRIEALPETVPREDVLEIWICKSIMGMIRRPW
jgi:hypothetical protein